MTLLNLVGKGPGCELIFFSQQDTDNNLRLAGIGKQVAISHIFKISMTIAYQPTETE